MKEHRINVRFNLENETDRMIVAYLDGLRGTQQISRNSFIIQAIYEKIVEKDAEDFKEHVYCKNVLRFLGKSDEEPQKYIPMPGV